MWIQLSDGLGFRIQPIFGNGGQNFPNMEGFRGC